MSAAFKVFTDGASRGNPGHAGIGVVVLGADGGVVAEWSRYLGRCTNNVAEYEALLSAVEKVVTMEPDSVTFHLDSELVVKQLNGQYRVKDPKMRVLYGQVTRKLDGLSGIRFVHVAREKNRRADELANEAIDAELAGQAG